MGTISAEGRPYRILVVDDHGVLRAGLRILLQEQPDLEVVGEAADGKEALRLVDELRPDMVLLDIAMPGLDGIAAMKLLRRSHPEIQVLMLTAHEDTRLLQEAVEAGAGGYVVKRAVEEELALAIRAVRRGDLYVHPSVMRGLADAVRGASAKPSPAMDALTERETEVLALLGQGYTNRQVATQLGISLRTVESHRANLTDKLGLQSRAELTRYALEHGLLHRG